MVGSGDTGREVSNVRRPVGRRSRWHVVRREEGARGGVGLSEADEVEMGQLEASERDRGASRVGSREREGDAMERG